MSFSSSMVMDSGMTWPLDSMLSIFRPSSVLRSISLSRSWLQSTAVVFGVSPATSGAKKAVPEKGRPRQSVRPGTTLSLTFFHTFSTSCASKPSGVLGPGPWPSISARLQGIRTRPGSDWIIACMSSAKYAVVLPKFSAPLSEDIVATMSSASARVKSRRMGRATQGTRYSRNSTCFKLWGNSQITKLWTPMAKSRWISARISGHAMEASMALPLARACFTFAASGSSDSAKLFSNAPRSMEE
mmetsp:Transcript_92806/g.266891  ORF Transcript_92806/g.266891 Transcript_92806/m.266891 type:complete len:243 (-) Transcript_92806:2182-2910(-)